MRVDIWTRKLTFENGAVLETTDEHPLYVEGSGFAKAKEVGIGSSIVTRAGPSAKVVAVGADVRQATVYNFTVADFHTYFVGDAALWVHNAPPTCNLGEYSGRETIVKGDASTIRSLMRENEAVNPLVGNGYGVHQNPPTLPNGKNPDYFLKGPGINAQGEYFDCLAPSSSNADGIVGKIAEKINKDQAPNVVLNLTDSSVDLNKLRSSIDADLAADPTVGTSQLENLRMLLVIDRNGNLFQMYP